jgi:PleD family two-component response regulator
LWLPASEVSVPPQTLVTSDAPKRSVAGLVLLVDDEETVRAAAKQMLQDLGYEVVEHPPAKPPCNW